MKYKDYIYLDYAATTPLDPLVEEAFLPYLKDKFGNPGSLHKPGQDAITAVDDARQKIADILNVDFHEVIFTGSATEANNLILRGVVKKALSEIDHPKIITSTIEHPSVINTVRDLEDEGVEVVCLEVDKDGFIDLNKLKEELDDRTVLVSVMYANNEIGSIQPVQKIAEIVKDSRSESKFPVFHTDAVQAFQYCPSDIKKLGVDAMTLSAHKIYGPKGIGLLVNKKTEEDEYLTHPVITGGGQEFSLRSGTENVAFITAFAKAIELISKRRSEEKERMLTLGKYFFKNLKKITPRAEINGVDPQKRTSDVQKALPNIYNVYFPEVEAEELLIKLDMQGVGVSAGSACSARSVKASPIIKSLGHSEKRANSSLRFSFGKNTTKKELTEALKRIKEVFSN